MRDQIEFYLNVSADFTGTFTLHCVFFLGNEDFNYCLRKSVKIEMNVCNCLVCDSQCCMSVSSLLEGKLDVNLYSCSKTILIFFAKPSCQTKILFFFSLPATSWSTFLHVLELRLSLSISILPYGIQNHQTSAHKQFTRCFQITFFLKKILLLTALEHVEQLQTVHGHANASETSI